MLVLHEVFYQTNNAANRRYWLLSCGHTQVERNPLFRPQCLNCDICDPKPALSRLELLAAAKANHSL